MKTDHSRPRKLATQKSVAKDARDPKLCVCASYLAEAHHHCEGCGFTIHRIVRFCGECLFEKDCEW